jgi:DNA-binding MarR family transcriptional regulator
LSRLVQRLEHDGLVVRAVDPDDRRATTVALTRAGRARFRRAHAVYTAALEEHLGRHLGGNSSGELASRLEQLAELVSR